MLRLHLPRYSLMFESSFVPGSVVISSPDITYMKYDTSDMNMHSFRHRI